MITVAALTPMIEEHPDFLPSSVLAWVLIIAFPDAFSNEAFLVFYTRFLPMFVMINLYLMFFNLLPIPPLDGSRIAFIFLPVKFYFGIMRYERYIQIAMFALLFLGAFDGILADLSYYLLVGILYLIQLIPIFRF